MPRVPIASVGLQTGGSQPFAAPGTASMQDVSGRQIEQFGGAVSQFGREVSSVAEALQDQIDDAATKEAYTQFANNVNEMLLRAPSEEDPNGGYLNTVGKDAVGERRKRTLDGAMKRAEEIEQGLANKMQRGMFREAATRHMVGIKARVYGHEAEQLYRWDVGQTEAMRDQAVLDTVEAYIGKPLPGEEHGVRVTAAAAEQVATGRPDLPVQEPQGPVSGTAEAQQHLNIALDQANRTADLRGYGKDDARRKNLVRDVYSDVHSGIVQRLISTGRAAQAQRYLGSIKEGELEPSVNVKLHDLVARAVTADVGMQQAQSSIETIALRNQQQAIQRAAESGQTTSMRPDLDSMKNEVRLELESRKLPAKVYEEALSRAEHSINLMKEQQTAEDVRRLQAAQQFMVQNNAIWRQLPPAMLREIEAAGQLDAIRKFSNSGGQLDTDPRAMGEVYQAEASGELKKMSHADIFTKWFGRLDRSDMERAIALRDRLNGQSRGKGPRMVTVADVTKNALNDIGIDPRVNFNKAYLFQKEVDKRIDAFETAAQKEATVDDMEQIAAEVKSETAFQEAWFTDPRVVIATVPEAERKGLYLTVEGFDQPIYLEADPLQASSDAGKPPAEWKRLSMDRYLQTLHGPERQKLMAMPLAERAAAIAEDIRDYRLLTAPARVPALSSRPPDLYRAPRR